MPSRDRGWSRCGRGRTDRLEHDRRLLLSRVLRTLGARHERNFLRETTAASADTFTATNTPVLLSVPTGLRSLDGARSVLGDVKSKLKIPAKLNSGAGTIRSGVSWVKNKLDWVNAIGDVWNATVGYSSSGSTSGSATPSPATESSRDSTCYADINYRGATVSSSDLKALDQGMPELLQECRPTWAVSKRSPTSGRRRPPSSGRCTPPQQARSAKHSVSTNPTWSAMEPIS